MQIRLVLMFGLWIGLANQLVCGQNAVESVSTQKFQGAAYTVRKVDLTKEKLELFHSIPGQKAFSTFDSLKAHLNSEGRELIFAMNAGMYQSAANNYAPQGLYIENGKELFPINLNSGNPQLHFFNEPNGVFSIQGTKPQITKSKDFTELMKTTEFDLATQSGPMLLIDGKWHPSFTPTWKGLHIRSGVGVPKGEGSVLFLAISEDEVTVPQFAEFFRTHLKCHNALYLDGFVSGFYDLETGRNRFRRNLGPILAITR